MQKLTRKQQNFADLVASGMTQKDAYAKAYGTTQNRKSLGVRGSVLAAKPEIKEAIAKSREPIIQALGLTLESHLQTLSDIANEARQAGQYSAAVAAEIARAKAAGLHIERSEQTVKGLIANVTVQPDQLKTIAAKLLNDV